MNYKSGKEIGEIEVDLKKSGGDGYRLRFRAKDVSGKEAIAEVAGVSKVGLGAIKRLAEVGAKVASPLP